MFLQLLERCYQVVVLLVIEGVHPGFDESQVNLPFPHYRMISAKADIS
ncbi:hypothetical protein L840_3634 [Mycobacterium sp. MAC_011194_8550]|nr:hypothetical protein L839_1922 [Mycobacterium avium MAV_120809_2495]ETZ56669.1 hypothetical protein L840_3634 [Mycobacterium sp. MAC_011194_8550]